MSEEFRYIIRFEGTDLKGELPVLQALTKMKGVGRRLSKAVLDLAGVDPELRMGNIQDKDLKRIGEIIADPIAAGIPSWMLNRHKDRSKGINRHVTGSDLILAKKEDIDRLRRIRSYRGTRHQMGLKVRGQRTKTTGRKGRAVGVSRRRIQRQQSR